MLKAFAAIYAGWGTSEPFLPEEAFRPLGSRGTEEARRRFLAAVLPQM
jgi:hypothetical protein